MGAGPAADQHAAALRALPAVHELAAVLDAPHALAVAAARRAIDEQRTALRAGREPATGVERRARERATFPRAAAATGSIFEIFDRGAGRVQSAYWKYFGNFF